MEVVRYKEKYLVCLLYTFSEPTRLRRISYAVFCLKKKKKKNHNTETEIKKHTIKNNYYQNQKM